MAKLANKTRASKVDKKAARAVSKEIREAFYAVRVNLLGAVDDNIEEALRVLEENINENNPKAMAAARRGFRELRSDLRYEVLNRCNGNRGYHTEDAIHRQFGLMTINGIVKA